MPDTLPRPEAAGPSFPVKRLPLGLERNNVNSAASTSGTGSITSTPNGVPFSPSKKQDRVYSTRRVSAFGEHDLLLSERDSIFATHYAPVENDTSTPDLPPLAGGVAEPYIPETLGPNMEFSLPSLLPTSSKLSIRPSFTAARSGPGGIPGGLKQYGTSGPGKSSDRQTQAGKSTTHGIRRVASDGHPWPNSVHVKGASTPLYGTAQSKPTLDELAIMEDDTAPTEANIAEHKDGQDGGHAQGPQRQPAMSQAMQSPRLERSVSRGRTHVDRSIEATLTNAEPGQNIRSRKSSHFMGVFREKTSPLESRQLQTSVSHAEGVDHTQTMSKLNLSSGRTPARPASATPAEAIPAEAGSTTQEIALPERHQPLVNLPGPNLDHELPSSQFSPTPKLPQSSTAQLKLPSQHEHDPYFRKQDAVKQSKGSHVPAAPLNLLEQISEYHNNLVPIPKDRTGVMSHEDTHLTDRRQLHSGDLGEHADDNEEHISSAVYFPHPVPVEDLEHFGSPEARPLGISDPIEIGPPAPGSVQNRHDVKRPSVDLAPPEHIDISVQSKHEKRVFHGDYQPPDEVQYDDAGRDLLPTIKEWPAESYTIASDSEVESSEELGATSQTDDGDITPTITPIQTSHLRPPKRSSISTGPRGAVLLEPYSHQVGGHSTIFRFSRRAVCKQLNNRENEFYERIERRHPDLLRFLPRYIGVLNVTFSKGPKPSKDTTIETHQIPPNPNTSNEESGEAATDETKSDDSIKKRNSPRIATNEQRIVSQSQHIGERPQVTLEQNRHIVPFSLFDSARRSRNTELQQSHDRGPHSPEDSTEVDNLPPQVSTPSVKDSPGRPALPSPPSWGKTSVNSKFGEQILLSVFAPTPAQHHKKHAKSHTTIPRARESSVRRREHQSADPVSQTQNTESVPTAEGANSAQAEDVSAACPDPVPDDKYPEPSAAPVPPDAYPAFASVFEEPSDGLERTRTTNIISSAGSPVDRSNDTIRRRHSGISLGRRGTSAHDETRGHLENYDEEGYGGDSEENVSQMEPGGDNPTTLSQRPSTVSQNVKKATSSMAVVSDASKAQPPKDMDDSLHPASAKGSGEQHGPAGRSSSPNHLPLNPKEAQLAKPDQRVVLFLLLEDLTADMGRPCVLDLKMGTRQYGVEASPKKVESQRRKCKTTTSQQLGVRICGMQSFDVKKQQPAYEDKYFGRDLKAGREFREALTRFLYDGVSYASVTKRIPTILEQISTLENMVRRLPGYRFYASSLLMLYDAEPEKSQRAKEKAAKVKAYSEHDGEKPRDKGQDGQWRPPIELKIVDFANCVTGEDPLPSDASCPPFHPGTVDRGYLRGLRTLKMYFQRILRDITESEFVERGESEATGVDMLGAAGTHAESEVTTEEDEGEISF